MRSIWESAYFHPIPHLAVIGGGITGLFTALYYKRAYPGHHVMVLEKGPFPSGASVKNAGFACFGSPSELLADMDREGTENALSRVEERWLGLHDLRQELGDVNIGFGASGGHEVFRADGEQYTQVAERFDALNEALRSITGTKTYRWDDTLIGSNGLHGLDHLVANDLEGHLDSGAMMLTLMRKVITEGVLFRSMAEVSTVDDGRDQVDITLIDGTRILAARAVVSTNGYTSRLIPGADVIPARGQILLTHPIPGLRLHGTFHYDEGFYYFRDHLGAVMLGGGRNLDIKGETTDEEGTTPKVQQELERLMREMILPGQEFSIAQRWSGVMGFRQHGKDPLIQRISERIVLAAGLSGMGVAIGIRVARKAVELVKD